MSTPTTSKPRDGWWEWFRSNQGTTTHRHGRGFIPESRMRRLTRERPLSARWGQVQQADQNIYELSDLGRQMDEIGGELTAGLPSSLRRLEGVHRRRGSSHHGEEVPQIKNSMAVQNLPSVSHPTRTSRWSWRFAPANAGFSTLRSYIA